MTKAFEDQLTKIKNQEPVLENLDERAVELGVILPLLRRLGWDTEDLTQIYPQRVLPNGGRVDYDLQFNGSSRIFVEAKRWSHSLNEDDEKQLAEYCLAGKPELAVLTNGRDWRLYLPPLRTRRRGQGPQIRQFLVFDITNEPRDAEKNLRRFLAQDKMVSNSVARKTVEDARALFKEKQNHAAVMRGLAEAFSELKDNPALLAEFISEFAKRKGVQPSDTEVMEFLSTVSISSQPSSVQKKFPKPVSFTFSPGGERPITKRVTKFWKNVLLGVCALMIEWHPETFGETVLKMPDSFSRSDTDLGWAEPIKDTGIYVKKGDGVYTKKICSKIVALFGYPQESLTIEET